MPKRVRNVGYSDFTRWVVFGSALLLLGALFGKAARAELPPTEAAIEEESENTAWGLTYFGIFYGPSLKAASSFQPTIDGLPDEDRPLLLKNYLTLGKHLSENVVLSGTAYWTHRPVRGQDLSLRDPYLRLAHQGIVNTGSLVWYGDVRAHLAVSGYSRDNDILAGFQTFHILTYQVGTSRLTLGTYGSARYNLFGPQGNGDDVELYLGPNATYQLTPTVALTVLYEMGMSHPFGAPPGQMVNDGTDLQPGLNWDITPSLMLNPYVNLYTGDRITLGNSSFGATLHWQLF